MFNNNALIEEMPDLRRFALRLTGSACDADDLLQATILRAIEKKHLFQADTNLNRWACKIMFNLFVSAEKGFGDFHIITNVGLLLPVDGDAKSTILHYHIHADYYVCKLFIHFVVANGYSVVSPGTAVPLDTEGYDLTNFGSSASDGVTQATVGAGFRSRLTSNIDFGFSYEKAVVKPEGLVDDRYTVDFVIRF